jgi:hypothetical protein
MREFLIRTVSRKDWPAFHSDLMGTVLVPVNATAQRVDGQGDFCVRFGSAEISYSGEEVGWQVTISGELADADKWVDQVTLQVSVAAGESCEWVDLG